MTAPRFPSLMCKMGGKNRTTLENVSEIFIHILFLAHSKLPVWASVKAQERLTVCVKTSSGPWSALLGTLNSVACFEEMSEKMGNVSITALALRSLLQVPQDSQGCWWNLQGSWWNLLVKPALDGGQEERSPPWANRRCQKHPSPLHPWLVSSKSCGDGRRKPHHQPVQNES